LTNFYYSISIIKIAYYTKVKRRLVLKKNIWNKISKKTLGAIIGLMMIVYVVLGSILIKADRFIRSQNNAIESLVAEKSILSAQVKDCLAASSCSDYEAIITATNAFLIRGQIKKASRSFYFAKQKALDCGIAEVKYDNALTQVTNARYFYFMDLANYYKNKNTEASALMLALAEQERLAVEKIFKKYNSAPKEDDFSYLLR